MLGASFRCGILVNHNPPCFFVSAESKGLSDPVSSLDATLTGGFISVDSKGARESRKWKCGNGKWQETGRASAALDSEGFRRIAMDPSSRQTTGSARSRVTRGREVADKGRRSFLRRGERQGSITRKVLAVNVYLVCNSNGLGNC